MSYTTNVLITCTLVETEAIERLNKLLSDNDHSPLQRFKYDGHRVFTISLYGGAFNYFNEDEFLEAAAKADWKLPEHTQIFIKAENAEKFDVYSIEEDKLSMCQKQLEHG